MTSKILNAWGANVTRSCLLQLLVAAVVLPLGGACVLIPLYIVQNGNYDDITSALILAIPMGGFLLLIFGGTLAFAAWVLVSRQRRLDAAFTPLGLAGRAHLLTGRQYHGAVQGRQVDVYFSPGSGGLRGFASPSRLDLYVSTPLRTSLALGTKDTLGQAVAKMMNRRPLPIADPDYGRLDIFPLDELWSRALLADPAAKAALLRLTADRSPYELRQFYVRPEALHLSLYRPPADILTAENARQWLDDLVSIARIAESLPPPGRTEDASALERDTRANRDKITRIAWGLTCGGLAAASACAVGAAGIMWWATNQSR